MTQSRTEKHQEKRGCFQDDEVSNVTPDNDFQTSTGSALVAKVAEELQQADVDVGGVRERWSEDTLPLPGAEEAETQMSENKNSPERGGQKSAHISALHCETQFVRARVSNWPRILTSLHTFFALHPRTSAVRIMTQGVQMG